MTDTPTPPAKAVLLVSPAVRRAEQQQHRTASALNKRMEEVLLESPDVNDWPVRKIERTYPDLVRLMKKAAAAQLRLVVATTAAARKLQLTAGLAIPQLPPRVVLDPRTAQCETCGCGWLTPCAGGCTWDPAAWAAGRAICSAHFTEAAKP